MAFKISVIVPVYHGKQYIDKMTKQIEEAAVCCESAAIELLFVNDAPDDPITMPVESETISVRIFNSEINRGIHGARVWGLSMADGEYVHFLDQDDEIAPSFYRSQLSSIGTADIVYCKGYNGRQEIYGVDRCFVSSCSRESILKRPPIISPGQALIRKDSIPSIWKEHLMHNNGSDDYYLWLAMVSDDCRFVLNDKLCFRHTRVGGNFCQDVIRARKSDEEMVELLVRYGNFSEEEKKMLSILPEKLFTNRYNLVLKEQQFLVLLDSVIWCESKKAGISRFFKEKGYKKIAIYGAGMLGQSISSILEANGIEVEFFIDRNAEFIVSDKPAFIIEEAPFDSSVNAVLITLLSGLGDIEEAIRRRTDLPIWGIQAMMEKLENDCFRQNVWNEVSL